MSLLIKLRPYVISVALTIVPTNAHGAGTTTRYDTYLATKTECTSPNLSGKAYCIVDLKKYLKNKSAITIEEAIKPLMDEAVSRLHVAEESESARIANGMILDKLYTRFKASYSLLDINGDGKISLEDDLNGDNRITAEDAELYNIKIAKQTKTAKRRK